MLVVILAIDMLASFCSTFMFAVAANLPLNFKTLSRGAITAGDVHTVDFEDIRTPSSVWAWWGAQGQNERHHTQIPQVGPHRTA